LGIKKKKRKKKKKKKKKSRGGVVGVRPHASSSIRASSVVVDLFWDLLPLVLS
jgi:hypothetical protein